MRFIKYVAISTLAAIILLTLATSCAPTAPKSSVKIGLLLDFSGMGGADIGPYHKEGVELKLDEVGYQVAGRKIELIIEDNAGDPALGAQKAKKLVEADKVDAVIGPVWAHVASATAPIFAEAKIPQFLCVGEPVDIMKLSAGNLYWPRGTHCASSYYSGVYAAGVLGYRTAVVLHDDFSTGQNQVQGFTGGFTENGGTIVQTIKTPLGTFDFAPFVSQIEEADVLAIWIIPTELPVFYKQYYEFGLNMPIMYTYLQAWDELWQPVGDNCLGTIGQVTWSSDIDNEVNKQFLEAFESKYNKPANMFHETGYALTSVILDALEATNGDATPDKINGVLKQMSFDVPEGKISFTPEGVGIGDEFIVKVVKENNIYQTETIKVYEDVVRKAPWE